MKAEQITFLAIGVTCLVAGCAAFARSLRRIRQWTRGEGMILGYREDYDANFIPKVQFKLTNGDELTFESQCSASPKRSPAGSRVRVLYSPERPSDAEVLSFSNFWLLPIFALGFGLTFTLIGILLGKYG